VAQVINAVRVKHLSGQRVREDLEAYFTTPGRCRLFDQCIEPIRITK
jgi:hypothetical protein